MATDSQARSVAITFSLVAAFLWATYYIFVLAITPGAEPSAVLAYPFLFGGVAYAAWAIGRGEGRALLAVWKEPAAYLRTGLLVLMQVAVLAATYLVGPVDAALLSLIGDVVATPLIVALGMGLHRAQVRSPWFAAGLLLSLAGGTLTIVGGKSLAAVPPLGWLVVPAVPLAVAAYFLLAARANERAPPAAVVGQSVLAAGIVSVAISPLIPGGFQGLAVTSAHVWAILLALGLTSFFAAEVLYFTAIRRAGLVLPPMLMTGIPVFTLLLSTFVLDLPLPLVAALGIPVAVLGALLTLRAESRAGALEGGPLSGTAS